jgi:hypothetical protein
MRQPCLEAQMSLEGTIWKFEGIRRSGSGDPFFVMVAGAEHEFPMLCRVPDYAENQRVLLKQGAHLTPFGSA